MKRKNKIKLLLKKNWKYLLMISLLFFINDLIVSFIAISFFSYNPANNFDNNIVYNETEFLEIIEQELINISESNIYIPKIYDCTEFSWDLYNRLKEKGIYSYCKSGLIFDDEHWSGHTWVALKLNGKEINLESTAGYIISEEYLKTHYFPIFKGHCL